MRDDIKDKVGISEFNRLELELNTIAKSSNVAVSKDEFLTRLSVINSEFKECFYDFEEI